MKLYDDYEPELIPQKKSITARVTTIIVLSGLLLGALHWAMNVTTANARQVSNNLTQIEHHLQSPSPHNGAALKHSGPVVDFPGDVSR